MDYVIDNIPKLGRGTSSLEGMGLSYAIAESLIRRQVSQSIWQTFSLVENAAVFRLFRNSFPRPCSNSWESVWSCKVSQDWNIHLLDTDEHVTRLHLKVQVTSSIHSTWGPQLLIWASIAIQKPFHQQNLAVLLPTKLLRVQLQWCTMVGALFGTYREFCHLANKLQASR